MRMTVDDDPDIYSSFYLIIWADVVRNAIVIWTRMTRDAEARGGVRAIVVRYVIMIWIPELNAAGVVSELAVVRFLYADGSNNVIIDNRPITLY